MSEIIYYATPYYRISNDDGDISVLGKGESNSISNQRSLIEDYVKDKPEIVLCQERIDDGFSGVDFERPAFQRMLQEVKEGKTNCIIVKDLSRFGRNYIEVGRFIQKIFPYLGVRFIAVNDNYDSLKANCAEDHIMLPFKNLMNDSYSRDISVKVRSQFAVKRKKGEFIGSFAVYGYEKSTENKNRLVIDKYAAAVVRDIYRWRISGMSNERIAEKLNGLGVLSPAEYKQSKGLKYQTGFQGGKQAMWSPAAVRRILTDQTYLGCVVQGKRSTLNHKVKKVIEKKPEEWVVVENMHAPVITEMEFGMVQDLMKLDTRVSPGKREVYLLSGLLECAGCKERMVRKMVSAGKAQNGNKRTYPYYMCAGHKRNSYCCSSHMTSEKELKKAVLTVLGRQLLALADSNLQAVLERMLKTSAETGLDRQTEETKEEIKKLRSLYAALEEDLASGTLDEEEYLELKEIYRRKREEQETRLAYLKEEQKPCSAQTPLPRGLLLTLVKKITVFEKKRIKISFRFHAVMNGG